MTKIVNYIVNKITGNVQKSVISQNTKRLSFLAPGKDGKELLQKYYQQKIRKTIIITIGIAVLLTAAIVNQTYNSQIKEGNLLARNKYGKGTWEIDVNATIQEEKYPIKIEVKEQCLTKEEADVQINKLIKDLPLLIKGENTSIEQVVSNLNLQSSYPNYPFTVRWSSSDFSILQDDGRLGDTLPLKHRYKVVLHAVISYEDMQKETDISVTVCPPKLTKDEKQINMLEEQIQSMQNITKTDTFLKLPDNMDGKKINWKEKKDGIIPILVVLSVILIIGIWIGSDNDLLRKCKKRERSLTLEYSEFVSKLQLLIGSGMTIRGAMERMGADYIKQRKEGGKERYVYEELLLCIRKLQDGVSEVECYDYFGKRCSLLCYKKLSSLLAQNIRKGTSGLTYALSNETKMAFEERKQQARRMGEEAQTKLLFPMILMLMMVMVIIMIPAYFSFGGL